MHSNKNTISERIADFLERYPPFNELHQRDLLALSSEVIIRYHDKDSIVFKANESPHRYFYIVHKGAVLLEKEDQKTIIDLCDEGDIFGLRPLMANENYKMEARAYEESILYALPIAVFKPFAQSYEEIGDFLIESFASNTRNPYSKDHRGSLYGESETGTPASAPLLAGLQPTAYSKKIISCTPTTDIKGIAKKMTKKRVGAMLIMEKELPVGIITDKDIRNKIATGMFPISAKASDIMSTPVITYPKTMTVTQAQMAMMKSNISHLCLTEDGTPNTPAVGILSKHDLMLELGNNPAVLIKAIKRTRKIKKLKRIRLRITQLLKGYLDQNIPLTLTSKIITELNDACIKQVLQLSLKKMKTAPPVAFAWLSMGSQGRSEQLLHTDQDNAIIFEDVAPERLKSTTDYFLNLAREVTRGLNEIGYEYCPAEMMASNPDWCRSLSGWKSQVSHWIGNPGPDEVLLSSIFFDFNRAYGDAPLVSALSEYILEQTANNTSFFLHLAKGALQNPSPTGFFRQFLVEADGAHKDFFDVKRRALMPLIDAARVLVLSHQIKAINNTAERFEKLAVLEPKQRTLYLSCSYAVKALLKFRTKQGLLHSDSGRFIALDTLTKEEKVKLKRTFKTIKELQELVRVRFQVSNLLG
ncbi:DUF294 nucleotidyltransferase-like domain-containing protein [Maribacter sp. 2-571]|uniref:DUF294 nucleotidyltransferase-like domain-containing protein n=1 Tax=Maribacter sp. 2-571 TaxID=3417569 RepID=UPI003D32D72F